MLNYLIRRLLLIIPTLFGIMVLNFVALQFLPGGPIEQIVAQLEGTGVDATSRISGGGQGDSGPAMTSSMAGSDPMTSKYRGAQGLDPEFIKELEEQFGFDKPAHIRFAQTMWNYIRFDFGTSYFRDQGVIELIIDKMPVSISLGLWTTLLVYLISIPLGIKKAVSDGSRFDMISSVIVIVGYAIPGFLFAILLVVLFSSGQFLTCGGDACFPLRGLVSDNWESLSWGGKILDYLWHMVLPILALVISGFAGLTMLTKNSFLEEINKQFVITARAKGLTEHRVLYGHVFRNAMLIVIAGFPAAFISILFTGALLIEIIFSLDGLGLLGYEAIINRDYPIVFGTLYIFTLLGLLMKLIGDMMYVFIDPRIDFEARGG